MPTHPTIPTVPMPIGKPTTKTAPTAPTVRLIYHSFPLTFSPSHTCMSFNISLFFLLFPSSKSYGCLLPCTNGKLVSAIGCSGYCQCANGGVAGYMPCRTGTFFDYNGQLSNHAAQVTYTYLSNGPLPTPTPQSPTSPALISPTVPTPTLPTTSGSWYLDWERTATCDNDGRERNWMEVTYFSSSQADCCAAWFWW